MPHKWVNIQPIRLYKHSEYCGNVIPSFYRRFMIRFQYFRRCYPNQRVDSSILMYYYLIYWILLLLSSANSVSLVCLFGYAGETTHSYVPSTRMVDTIFSNLAVRSWNVKLLSSIYTSVRHNIQQFGGLQLKGWSLSYYLHFCWTQASEICWCAVECWILTSHLQLWWTRSSAICCFAAEIWILASHFHLWWTQSSTT